MLIVKLAMYGVLGVMMSSAGVSVIDNTLDFLAILGCVMVIDTIAIINSNA